jgi:thiamine-phosphate pyrophosphorylase
VRGLYPIVDVDFLASRGIEPVPFAVLLLAASPAILQLRAKSAGGKETLALLRALREPCRSAGTLLFANDRPDLAAMAGCDGVHVGQEDATVTDVRRFAPALRVGVSTHDPRQLGEALASAPDYVAYGPVFGTTSKSRPDPVVGVAGLAAAAAVCRAHGVPLVAIGGLSGARAFEVAPHADAFAVISGLLPPTGLGDVTERARSLQRAFAG